VEDFEHAVPQLLRVGLIGQGRLKDAWLAENADEDGHEALEEDRVAGSGGVVIEAVAQRRGCLGL
jgi:hypothetical protein